jgi:hypothetical protein
MRIRLAACFVALGVGLSGSAYAHHSMAGFERNKTVTLNGTGKQFKWANPHSWIELEVTNDKGAVDIWNVEMTSPAVLVRAGWKSTTLRPGDKVSISAHHLKTGEPGANFVSVTLATRQTLTDKPAPPAAAPANP